MQIEALLKTFIYLIASSLFVPVLIMLCLILLWLLFFGGTFFSEWLQRSRQRPVSVEEWRRLVIKNEHGSHLSGPLRRFTDRLSGLLGSERNTLDAEVETLLQEKVQALFKSLDKIRMVIRIGPGLGLIGTLIPMGTGLAALGQGDITRLSADLVIAFTTTVLGLSEGMTAYFMFTVKRRWVEEDVRTIEFLTEIMTQGSSPGEKQ